MAAENLRWHTQYPGSLVSLSAKIKAGIMDPLEWRKGYSEDSIIMNHKNGGL